MIGVTIQLQGFKELEAGLKMLPYNLRKKYLDASLKKGLQVVKQSEATLAPKKTGRLASSISIYGTRKGSWPAGAVTSFSVKPVKKKGGGFALILEYGAKRHVIMPKKQGGRLRLYGNIFVPYVVHPGIVPKRSFLVASWEPNIPKITEVVHEELAKRIEAELMQTEIGSMGFSF